MAPDPDPASARSDTAVQAFLRAVEHQDRAGALAVLAERPGLAAESLHVAAVLGDEAAVRRMLAASPEAVHGRAGDSPAEPLLWLCYSPFHGESPARDAALLSTAKTLLDAGADPKATDARYGVPALYAVTGVHNVPAIARLLLDIEALELLREYGVELNGRGDWGNTPLYFLLRYQDVARMESVRKGLEWLLANGADPDVPSTQASETALHAAVMRQHADIVRTLIEHGADVNARRGDGRSVWTLAMRAGATDVVSLLEEAGARPEPLSPIDALIAACALGNAERAVSLTSAHLVGSLGPEALELLPEAASTGRTAAVAAFLAAGWPVDAVDGNGATALHHAAFGGRTEMVRVLLGHDPELERRDTQHHSTPLGWACFAVDHFPQPGGDYPGTVRLLIRAGAVREPDDPADAGVRAVLDEGCSEG